MTVLAGNPAKRQAVEEYEGLLKGAKSAYLADYIGLDVEQMQELRKLCRDESIRVKVVKNRLMKLAAANAGLEELAERFAGPVIVAVSETDEVAPAKLFVKFAKKNKKPTLKGAVVDGVVYGAEEANVLAALPGLNELRAQLLSVIAAPSTQIVRVIAEPGTQLVRALNARCEQPE